MINIDERRQAAWALRESEQRFQSLVEAAPNAMVLIDRAGKIVLVNTQAERDFLYSRAELVGRPVEMLVPERFRGHHPGLRESFFSDPQPRPMGAGRDLYGLKKDGSEFPVEIGLNPIETDEGTMVLSAIVDITARKAADVALRKSEQRFQLVVEAAPNAMVLIDRAGRIALVNTQAERVFLYSRPELVGRPVEMLVPERFRAHHSGLRESFFSGPQPRPMGAGRDLYGLKKDGSEFPVEIGLNPIDIDERTMVLSSIVDITARQAADLALRKSEQRYSLLVDGITDYAVFMLNLDGIVTNWNRGAERIKGYRTEEIVGQHFSRFYTEEERAANAPQHALEIAVRDGRYEAEALRVRKDGSRFWANVVIDALRDDASQLIGFAKITRDISERVEAERALHESEQRHREQAEYLTAQVFERSPDGVSIVGRDYRYQRVNPVYERYHKMPADKIVGERVADLLGTEVFEQTVKPGLDRCFAGEEVSFERWFTTEDFRHYLVVTCSPLRRGSEKVDAALVITRDLTEHMLASEALQQAQANLERVNRVMLLGEMTASIVHEVGQPIAATIANAGAGLRWLATQPPDMEEARQALGRIARDGNRAREVIGSIRALLRKLPARRDPLNINEAILGVIAMTQRELQRNRVHLRTRLSSGLPFVPADRVQLQQVVLNLIVNGIEAMNAEDDRPRELVVGSGRSDSNDVFVEVRDCGPGLDAANLDRLFQSFYTTKPDGMGMGLAISRSIVEAHGGRLSARPNTPHGAVFHFTLPVAEESSTVPVQSPE